MWMIKRKKNRVFRKYKVDTAFDDAIIFYFCPECQTNIFLNKCNPADIPIKLCSHVYIRV